MLSVANVDFAIRTLGRRRRLRLAAAGARATCCCPTCRCATSPSGSSPPGSTPAPACRSTSPSRSPPCRPTCARCSRRSCSACRGSGRRSSPRSRIRLANASPIKRLNARLWLRVADRIGATLVRTGGTHTAGHPAGVRASAGSSSTARCASGSACGRVRFAASGAAPIAPDVLRFFMGIGVPMHEVYGMTENTAIATGNRPRPGPARHGRRAAGRRGAAHRPGHRRDPDPARRRVRRLLPRPGGDRAAMTPDGWLRTGDVGEWVDARRICGSPTGPRTS